MVQEARIEVRLESWYTQVANFNQHNRSQWVAAQATLIPAGSKVLDVGAGCAPYRSLFSHCEYRAHDFGQEPSTIGKYAALDYQSDITAIPVPNESFDVILCTEVLEHVPEPIRAIHELARILKREGRLLVSAPLGSFLHQEPYHFYGGFTPHWYRKYLSEAGLQIESLEANRGFFSWFGQEAMRFSALIDPRRTGYKGKRVWMGLTALWLITLPSLRGLFPMLGAVLDSFGLEQMATVGYHILAVKR